MPARGPLYAVPLAVRQASPIESVGALAERFELNVGQLEWLADVRGLERTAADERLRNYRYRLVARRAGAPPRLIEAPKGRLKEIQRIVLREVLAPVPVHPAAHGFVPGRSAVTHAAMHSGRALVIRFDLRDFFASVGAGRVRAMFRSLGYSRELARVLAGLGTNCAATLVTDRLVPPAGTDPALVWRYSALRRQLASPHLPQGAPTSPAIANLAGFRLDRRLSGLAAGMGLTYSRYADDLVFSGDRSLRRGTGAFCATVAEIAVDEGFSVNRAKTAVAAASGRQRVCGLVVNARPNVARDEYDRLKATIHRARLAEHVPAVDAAHLRGRIAWVQSVNPGRGARLLRDFNRITWSG